ncbi:IS3 family transposase [Maribellus luteus]|uniref:IS3 family transposase n=1 Tax=Maribellus luteus TaxID=2305463 RepID=A0A399SQN4_9BACT|nr:IS3 family transposase [Maribellus luteus]
MFGISRQAYYKHLQSQVKMVNQNYMVVRLVASVRGKHPRMGTRKIYHLIKPDLEGQGIKMGRDALFSLLADEDLLIRKRKRMHITTNSNHWFRKYPNLVKGFEPTTPNQLWVSDITYIRTAQGFQYLFLLTDAYSKRILGYRLARNMDSIHAVNALQDAIENSCQLLDGLIHHSDRGLQYCSHSYVNTLKHHQIAISMTESGDPLDNAVAERVNGILKDEYINIVVEQTGTITQAKLDEIINRYNNQRPHLSCDMLTPTQVHLIKGITIKKRWKNYYRKQINLEL